MWLCRYEDDPVIGQRLYREIKKVEVKKGKGKNVQPIPSSCYQWETVATNLDEFQDVSVSDCVLLVYINISTANCLSCFISTIFFCLIIMSIMCQKCRKI